MPLREESEQPEVLIKSVCSSKSGRERTICSLVIPNWGLQKWYYEKTQTSSYIGLLNKCIVGQALTISSSASRVEENLRRRAAEVISKVAAARGRQREAILCGNRTIGIEDKDIVSFEMMKEELETSRERVKEIEEEMKGKSDEIETLKDLMILEQQKSSKLQESLTDETRMVNTGKSIDEVCGIRESAKCVEEVIYLRTP